MILTYNYPIYTFKPHDSGGIWVILLLKDLVVISWHFLVLISWHNALFVQTPSNVNSKLFQKIQFRNKQYNIVPRIYGYIHQNIRLHHIPLFFLPVFVYTYESFITVHWTTSKLHIQIHDTFYHQYHYCVPSTYVHKHKNEITMSQVYYIFKYMNILIPRF